MAESRPTAGRLLSGVGVPVIACNPGPSRTDVIFRSDTVPPTFYVSSGVNVWSAVIATGKVTLTQPATGSTLTILDGKTLTVNKTLTLEGTDGQTMTFPATSATLARIDAANIFTGNQQFNNLIQMAGTTSAFPAIKRNSTALNFRLADDSGDCPVTAAGGTFSGNLSSATIIFISTDQIRLNSGGANIGTGANVNFCNSTSSNSTIDTNISRSSAGTIRVGTTAQNALGKVNCAEYQIAATKVIGAQGAAVADATDAASVILRLNDLLARLRAATGHGLIA